MNSKYKQVGLYIVMILLVASLVTCFATSKKTKSVNYDLMVEASNHTKLCFETIKQYKIDNDIEISDQDIYECGMIGPYRSILNTSGGEIDAKLTSCNYNFTALYIKYFKKANLKSGDEVAMMFSGSFPCLNISAIVAAQYYGLKTYLMGSITGSNYGSIDENFNFIDMFYLLESNGLIDDKLDIVSAGSHDDLGTVRYETIKESINNRVNQYGYLYIEISDYKENIDYRINQICSNLPNLKLFINVGAQTIGVGKNECDITSDTTHVGYIKGYSKPNTHYENDDIGLVEYYLNSGIDVIHMLKLKQICSKENMIYNPINIPSIGTEGCYYETKYNIIFPIISLSFTIIYLFYNYIDNKKKSLNS